MKRKLILLIMLLLTTIIVSGCDITGIIPPISENSELTPEEIELIREYGYDSEYTIRWPDGYVDVYDTTGFDQMQEVLNQWNAVIGGPVVFRLSSNPNSPVKVYYKSIFEGCGSRDVKWNEKDYTLSTIDLQISNNDFSCGFPSSKYSLYLAMFKSVAGFAGWTTKKGIPYEEWSNFNTINDTMKKMVKALHKVPPGYCLIDENLEPEIKKVEGVKWQPSYQSTQYLCFLLVDYYGKDLHGPPPDDHDYGYPDPITARSPFYLTIIGNNFGSKRGNVSLEGKGLIKKITQYFTINLDEIEWSDNKIKVFPKFENKDLDFEPVEGAVLTIYKPDGKKAEYYVDIIPSIGRQPFGQCTWWTFKRALEEGKDKEINLLHIWGAYSNKVSLDKNYIPEKYDILIWTEEHHQAFVEEIINKEKGIVRISEYNVKYSEELYNGEEGYVTGEDKIYKFSLNSSPADYYYR